MNNLYFIYDTVYKNGSPYWRDCGEIVAVKLLPSSCFPSSIGFPSQPHWGQFNAVTKPESDTIPKKMNDSSSHQVHQPNEEQSSQFRPH